jgi:integrase
MPRFVSEALTPLLHPKHSDDLIFCSPGGGLLNNSNFRRDAFDPAVEHLGLAPFTPHDLRHTAASLAISAGASVAGVQTMLGHATPAITLSVYTHLFPADLRSVADKLDAEARRARSRGADKLPVTA